MLIITGSRFPRERLACWWWPGIATRQPTGGTPRRGNRSTWCSGPGKPPVSRSSRPLAPSAGKWPRLTRASVSSLTDGSRAVQGRYWPGYRCQLAETPCRCGVMRRDALADLDVEFLSVEQLVGVVEADQVPALRAVLFLIHGRPGRSSPRSPAAGKRVVRDV